MRGKVTADPITVRYLLKSKIIDEMAKCADTREKALSVLGHLTDDTHRLPNFGDLAQPDLFWQRVCSEISKGAIDADLHDLLDRFARLYQRNKYGSS